jgi:hypothetical protein
MYLLTCIEACIVSPQTHTRLPVPNSHVEPYIWVRVTMQGLSISLMSESGLAVFSRSILVLLIRAPL